MYVVSHDMANLKMLRSLQVISPRLRAVFEFGTFGWGLAGNGRSGAGLKQEVEKIGVLFIEGPPEIHPALSRLFRICAMARDNVATSRGHNQS